MAYSWVSKVRRIFPIGWLVTLLIFPGVCLACFGGAWLVILVNASVTLTRFWLFLPIILLPYMVLGWLIRRWRRPGRAMRYGLIPFGVALGISVLLILFAYTQVSELVTIPVGYRSSHKETLLWEAVCALYVAGIAAGLAVLVLPQKTSRP